MDVCALQRTVIERNGHRVAQVCVFGRASESHAVCTRTGFISQSPNVLVQTHERSSARNERAGLEDHIKDILCGTIRRR